MKHMNVDDKELEAAIGSTFQRRNVDFPKAMPIAFTPEFLDDGLKEKQWQAFLRRSMLGEYEFSLAQVTAELRDKLWPVLLRLREDQSQ